MAKKTLTQATYGVENVQGLADQVKNQASVVKQTLDKTGLDAKTYTNNTLISELQSETNNDSGAHAIGLGLTDFTANNMADGLQEVKDALDGVVLGQIPDGSLTDDKLSNTAGQIKDRVSTNTTNISTNTTDIDLLQNTTSYGTTVSGTDALTITTLNGGFTFTVGKSVRGIAVNNNTTSMTANIDTDGALPIKKLDGSSYVDVEADDFEDNKPFELICQTDGVIGDFFLLAPKGGSNIKSIQRGSVVINSASNPYVDIAISSVSLNNSICLVTGTDGNASISGEGYYIPKIEFINNSTLRISVNNASSVPREFSWQVIEYNNVKSKQSGTLFKNTSGTTNVTISSVILNKSVLFYSNTSLGADNSRSISIKSELSSSTNIAFSQYATQNNSIRWQVIEFK